MGLSKKSAILLDEMVEKSEWPRDWVGTFRANADRIGRLLPHKDMDILIRCFVIYQKENGGLGSPSPVHLLVAKYLEICPEKEYELCGWIIDNRVNGYDPWGVGQDFGARSKLELEELMAKEYARREHEKRLRKEETQKRISQLKKRRIQDDIDKLHNAVRRGDLLAVQALINSGISWKQTVNKHGSLVELAKDNNREKVALYLIEQNIR